MTKIPTLKVRAVAGDSLGYAGVYDNIRRRHGAIFNLRSKDHFSFLWMKAIGWTPEQSAAQKKEEVEAEAKKAASIADADAIASAATIPDGDDNANDNGDDEAPEVSMDMTRDELVVVAMGMDIDPPDNATKADIIALIEEPRAEDDDEE
jgi:hypothetical protein